MLKVILIGNVGADAVTQQSNGRTFTTFRVAHNEQWTDTNNVEHKSTTWIDCIMQDRPKVCDYIKQGTQIYVEGTQKLRVYSSEKDRCMKAGATINVQRVELLGGQSDEIPHTLVDKDGQLHTVNKYYNVADAHSSTLMATRGSRMFVTDANGWVQEVKQPDTAASTQMADTSNTATPSQPQQVTNADGDNLDTEDDGKVINFY